MTLVAIDADVLGRERTGDETYVRNLLRELALLAPAAGIRLAALTRRPDLVPEGVEPVEVHTRSQIARMALTLPRALRRLRADLVHTQYALPPRLACPGIVTVHDLSFEREPELFGLKDRLVFRRAVPAAVRRAARVLTVSERTKRDLIELYGIAPDRIVVTPNGIDPAFHPSASDTGSRDPYVLSVGAIQARKNQVAALEAATAAGLPLVVVGPEKDAALAEELRGRGARLEGYVEAERLAELYRGAACLVQASRFEGFGLPVLEAMASGTPVVAVREPALREVAGDAAVFVADSDLAEGIREAMRTASGCRPRDSSVPVHSAGAQRRSGRSPSTGRYSEREGLRGRRLARSRSRARELSSGDRAASRRDRRRLEHPRVGQQRSRGGSGARERPAAQPGGERQPRHRRQRRVSTCSRPTRTCSRSRTRSPRWSRSPTRIHAAVSPARRCAGRTGRGSRHAGASRPSAERSSDVRRSGAGGPRTRRQRDHYQLDERPTEPVRADWMLGAFLLMRRPMLDEIGGWDAGFRHYCEDIDLGYRAMEAGWERWYVPDAVVTHDYAAVIDRRFLSRHTLWHARGMARFVRKHPERLLAL